MNGIKGVFLAQCLECVVSLAIGTYLPLLGGNKYQYPVMFWSLLTPLTNNSTEIFSCSVFVEIALSTSWTIFIYLIRLNVFLYIYLCVLLLLQLDSYQYDSLGLFHKSLLLFSLLSIFPCNYFPSLPQLKYPAFFLSNILSQSLEHCYTGLYCYTTSESPK